MTADHSDSSWFKAYSGADGNWNLEDIGTSVWTSEGREIIGYWVKFAPIADQRVVAIMVHELLSQCLQFGNFTTRQIGNIIAKALSEYGDFHRTGTCFAGIEPQAALPPSQTPIYDEVRDAVYEGEGDDDDTPVSYMRDNGNPIHLSDAVEWLWEALTAHAIGGATCVRDIDEKGTAFLDGDFDLAKVVESVLDQAFEVPQEGK